MLSLAGFALLAALHVRVEARRDRLLLLFVFALAFFAAGSGWIHDGIRGDGHNPPWLSWSLFAGFVAVFAALHALAFALLDCALDPGGTGNERSIAGPAFTLALAWAAAEWLRSIGAWAFPWLLVGTLQVDNPLLRGLLPLFGVHATGFIAVLAASIAGRWLLSLAMRRGRRSADRAVWRKPARLHRWWALSTLSTLCVLGLALLALDRLAWTAPAADALPVAVLQSDYPQADKWDDDARARAKRDLLQLLSAGPATQARVLITPETYLLDAVQHAHGDYWQALARRASAQQRHLVVGAIYSEPAPDEEPTGQARHFNAIVHLAPTRTDVYAKRRLVPFGEYMPMAGALGWLYRDVFRYPLQGLTRAQPPLTGRLYVDGHEVAASICYEVAFAAEVAAQARDVGWLLNISNDAWFDSALYRWQAQQIARTRALETRRWLVRANNVGRSALIAPDGRVQQAPEAVAAVLTGEIVPRSGLTPYQRIGDAPLGIALLAALALALGRRRSPLRSAFH